MLEEMAMAFGSQIVAAEDVYPSTLEYRLHQIVTTHRGSEAVSTVYDGEAEVHRVYGKEYHQAIAHAKAWIDEQDASASEQDLHSAGSHP